MVNFQIPFLQKNSAKVAQPLQNYLKIVDQLDAPFCWATCIQLKEKVNHLAYELNGQIYSLIDPNISLESNVYINHMKGIKDTTFVLDSLITDLIRAKTKNKMENLLRHSGLQYVRGFKSSFNHIKDIMMQASDDAEAILALHPLHQSLQSRITLLNGMTEYTIFLRSEIIQVIQATVDVRNQLTLELLSS